MQPKIPLKLVILGHVDHGKSTLVGRLLHETGSLPEGKFESIEAACKKRGLPFEWAFLTDALQAERDQNVTIDTTQIWLRGKTRDTVIIDAPGHTEFLKNMVTGAAAADAALLVIDAKEGIGEQSRRHGLLLSLLGIKQVVVLVNKMDAVGYKQKAFKAVEKEIQRYLKTLNIKPICTVPISAREGDNVVRASKYMPWYKGLSVLKAIERFKPYTPAAKLPLRFPVQDVYKSGNKRILVGRVESGSLKIGDTLLFSPANTKAKVASIEIWKAKARPVKAVTGQSIGITLDTPIFVERGQVASHEKSAPLLTNLLRARLFWLGKKPLQIGDRYTLRIATHETVGEIKTISPLKVAYGDVAEVVIRTQGQIAVDDVKENPCLGRFVLLQEGSAVGGGIISTEGLFDQRVTGAIKSKHVESIDFGIARDRRTLKNRHRGGVLWFTGLSSAGKSTIAKLTQKKLFDKGCQVFVLDGDNIRQGLNRDLGFSAKDRSENIRRVAEVAALFAEAGMIVITSFISPYREDRRRARAIAPDDFHTVYIKASVKTCEKRDDKGLYKKARAGKIAGFTGISAPYEEPETPDLVLDTEAQNAEHCAELLVAYVERHLIKTR